MYVNTFRNTLHCTKLKSLTPVIKCKDRASLELQKKAAQATPTAVCSDYCKEENTNDSSLSFRHITHWVPLMINSDYYDFHYSNFRQLFRDSDHCGFVENSWLFIYLCVFINLWLSTTFWIIIISKLKCTKIITPYYPTSNYPCKFSVVLSAM